MHIEQRLETCGLCRRVLALQYQWYADRLPSASRDRICGRAFQCPACGYVNRFLTLMYAHALELKVVPGPEPFVPFPRSKLFVPQPRPTPAGRDQRSAFAVPVFAAAQAWMRHEMLLAWFASRLL